jgi:rSAM/selenodomain-associated transferase 2
MICRSISLIRTKYHQNKNIKRTFVQTLLSDLGSGMTAAMQSIAVIIPTLNAEAGIETTIGTLRHAPGSALAQIIVVDAGSTDRTAERAKAVGARVIQATRPGRGAQMDQGARASTAAWLLFLHADTLLSPGWHTVAAALTAHPQAHDRAGYFRLAFDDPTPAARRLERIVRWRARLGLPYGDQGLLISRAFYEGLGGFKPLPLMEDVDLVRRIGGRRLVGLEAEALTSAARYQRDGWVTRPIRNTMILGLWFLGVPPAALRRIYG